ncbi:MAG: hypothetical protein ACPGVU_23330, partial [Limisphaerales bacterium]
MNTNLTLKHFGEQLLRRENLSFATRDRHEVELKHLYKDIPEAVERPANGYTPADIDALRAHWDQIKLPSETARTRLKTLRATFELAVEAAPGFENPVDQSLARDP